MPRITTYAIDLETVKGVSTRIQNEISTLLGLPKDLVTLQVNRDTFIQDGVERPGDPFIEICLFDRGQEREDQVAKIVTQAFRDAGVPSVDVYLTRLEKRCYFENGDHF